MHSVLTLALLGLSLAATAQQPSGSSLTTSINEDGKTLSIQVDGVRNSQAIHYNRTFNTAGLSHSEQTALKNRVLDSLGIGQPSAPPPPFTAPGPPMPSGGAMVRPPQPPVPPDSDVPFADQEAVTFRCESCTGKIRLIITSDSKDYSLEKDTQINADKRFFPYALKLQPGNYRLVYYQNGVLQIQSAFSVRQGEPNTVVVK
ncbi:hypothetical protein GCM10027341_48560 [Spirosoma knui]